MSTGNIRGKRKPAASGAARTPPAADDAPRDVAQPDPVNQEESHDDAQGPQEPAPAPQGDVVPPTAPIEAAPPDAETALDGDADLPGYFGPKKKQLSPDEKLGNLIFVVETQISSLFSDMRAEGRLPELFRRVRKLIDKLEAEAAADGDQTEDCGEVGAESAAIERVAPVEVRMPPDLPSAAEARFT
jgi:hypothetical protein